jgi:hypothetical protein
VAPRRNATPEALLPNKLVKQCGYPTGEDKFFGKFFAGAIGTVCSSSPFGGTVSKTKQTYMNMAFVAYDRPRDNYMIAIAGTNGVSGFASDRRLLTNMS